jgi:FeS assembly SUF system protein
MRWPWSRNKKVEALAQHLPNDSLRDPVREVAPSSNPDATLRSDGNEGGTPPAHHHSDASLAVKDSSTMPEAVTSETNETRASDTDPSEATPSEIQASGASSGVEQAVVEMIKTVYDPEIPVDIYELGLIYEVDLRPENSVYIKMTLTSPMCPVAETLPPEVEEKVRMVEGVADVELELVWDPPWNPDMMSEAAKLELNM